MPTVAPLLRLEHVAKTYTSASAAPREVLRDIDLAIQPGQAIAITGPSGSGKSTLLNLMASLDVATSGRVSFDGRDLQQLDERARAALRNRDIGVVFQLHHLLPQCTVLENVLVPTLVAPRRDDARQRARELLAEVGLGERQDAMPAQLSGGERQRVALVRAMINRPRLLLADEPTGALDREAAAQVTELLLAMNRTRGVTLVVATHALDLARRMNLVLELSDGRLRSA